MAMTMIPPRSSATASAARNIFRPSGTLLLKIDSTPNENAMSVAIGIATPRSISGSLGHRSQKNSTGMSIPPHAPIIGRRAFCRVESSPTRISRFISNPTERKNIAIRKSLMTCISVIVCPLWLKRLKLPIESVTSCCQNLKYSSFNGEFATMSASMVITISTPLVLTYLLIMLMKL